MRPKAVTSIRTDIREQLLREQTKPETLWVLAQTRDICSNRPEPMTSTGVGLSH